MNTAICEFCGKEVSRRHFKYDRRIFCNRICNVAYQRLNGRKLIDQSITEMTCTKCSGLFPINRFIVRKNGKARSVCKTCHNQFQADKWIKNKIKAINYKGGKCFDCGIIGFPVIYDFHHRDPTQKDVEWSFLKKRSWEKICIEIDKCDLICSNCHRIRHYVNKEAFKVTVTKY